MLRQTKACNIIFGGANKPWRLDQYLNSSYPHYSLDARLDPSQRQRWSKIFHFLIPYVVFMPTVRQIQATNIAARDAPPWFNPVYTTTLPFFCSNQDLIQHIFVSNQDLIQHIQATLVLKLATPLILTEAQTNTLMGDLIPNSSIYFFWKINLVVDR